MSLIQRVYRYFLISPNLASFIYEPDVVHKERIDNLYKRDREGKGNMGLFDFFKSKKSSEEDEVSKIFNKVIERKKTLDDLISSKSISMSGGDQIPGAHGRFGLDVTNPIPVEGFTGLDNYLLHLSNSCGKKISWNRLGSTSSDNIDGMIDIYIPVDSSGKEYPRLYICMYCENTSEKIPAGFN